VEELTLLEQDIRSVKGKLIERLAEIESDKK